MPTSLLSPLTEVPDAIERTTFIGLGSNLGSKAGDPAATVKAAVRRLSEVGTLVGRSSLYATEPVGAVLQPPFVNAVVGLRSSRATVELLRELMRIEREFGRDRGDSTAAPKGPRTLDLDILIVGELVIQTPELIVPHPGLAERRFVLAPLAEIAPEVLHPVLKKTVAALLAALPDAGQNGVGSVRVVACDVPVSPLAASFGAKESR